MKTTTLLRIAASLALFQFIAHTSLVVSAHPTPRPGGSRPGGGHEVAALPLCPGHRAPELLGLLFRLRPLRELQLPRRGGAVLAARRARQDRSLAGAADRRTVLRRQLVYAALVWRFFFLVPLVSDVAIALGLGGERASDAGATYFTTASVPETGYHSLSLDAKPYSRPVSKFMTTVRV